MNSINKTILLISTFFLLLNLSGKDIETPPEALLYQYIENSEPNNSLLILNKILTNKRNKKWPSLPLIYFFKAQELFAAKETAESVNELTYITKKYPEYIEPWLELLIIYAKNKNMEKGYNLSRKAPLKATLSIFEVSPFKNIPKQTINKNYFKKLLFFLNIYFEILKNKNKRIKKSIKRYNEFIKRENCSLSSNSMQHLLLSEPFLTAFIDFQTGDINKSREILKSIFIENWKSEETVFHLLLINNIPSFKEFYLKEKERNSYDLWKKIWNENRRDWQKKRWLNLFNKYTDKFLTLEQKYN